MNDKIFILYYIFRRTIPILFLLALSMVDCVSPKEKIPDAPIMKSEPRKIIIYQLLVRLFGNKNTTNKPFGTRDENGVGKLNDVSDAALKGIRELGVTHVWYTGVIEHALLTDYTKFGISLDHPQLVKGRAGSPYAIKDYYDVDPDLAVDVSKRIQEFDELVERTHANELKVIIDFVPNHVARVYHSDAKPSGVIDLGDGDDKTVSFKPSNNFYYLPGQSFHPPQNNMPSVSNSPPYVENPAKASGNDRFTAWPSNNDWYETVKLNYGVDIQNQQRNFFDSIPNTWTKMKDILVYWANKKVDGFRCDMSEMVPVEFWNWAIPKVKAVNPELIFIAEIYNPAKYRAYIEQGHFDFLYDKVQLYDTLRQLVNQRSRAVDVAYIQESLKGITNHMVHFLENHDEQRFASPYFANDAWKAVPAMVVSATIDQSPMMIYFGQEVGEAGAGEEGFSGNDGRTTIFDYWGVSSHQKWMNEGKFDGGALSVEQKQLRQFYADILNFASTNSAIVSGDYVDLTKYNYERGNLSPLISVFVRTNGIENLLIVCNFSPLKEKAKIQLSDDAVRAMKLNSQTPYIGRDVLRSGMDIGFDNFTTKFELPAQSAFIFKIK